MSLYKWAVCMGQGRIQYFRQGGGGGGGVLMNNKTSGEGGGGGCCPRACEKQGFWTKEGVVNPKTP